MTVVLITTIKRFIGESFDVKPTTDIPAGSTLLELDTKNNCIYNGSAWTFTTVAFNEAIRGTQGVAFREAVTITFS